MDGLKVDITDEEIDDAVGQVRFEKGVGRHIELYGRYKGTVQTHEEGVAFVKVVETVLNYILDWRHKFSLRARARAKQTSKQIKQRVANNKGSGLVPFRR
jgi:hypothetical protein